MHILFALLALSAILALPACFVMMPRVRTFAGHFHLMPSTPRSILDTRRMGLA